MKKVVLIALGFISLVCIAGIVILYIQTTATQAKFNPLVEACRGNQVADAAAYAPTPGIHPSMGVLKRADGDLEIYTYAVPDEALAENVADTQLVLCLTETKEVLLESCSYTMEDSAETESVVERYDYERELTLVEAKTGQVLTVEVLTGDDPRECMEHESFRKGEDTLKVYGEGIGDGHLKEWLRPHVIVQ